MKPLIGITCNYTPDSTVGMMTAFGLPQQPWHMIAGEYIRAIEKAGGIPVVVPVYDDLQLAKDVVDRLDGIIISGGDDVDPCLYGEFITKEVGYLNPQRDKVEMTVLKYAEEETTIPILGICRGIQLMNVARGGSLYQDLGKSGYQDHFVGKAPINHYVHTVDIIENSRIHQIVGTTKLKVNSYHHQAIKQLADGFVVTATSDDGVIEAIEGPGNRYIVAVQWHPEMLYDSEINQLIFKDFIAQCTK